MGGAHQAEPGQGCGLADHLGPGMGPLVARVVRPAVQMAATEGVQGGLCQGAAVCMPTKHGIAFDTYSSVDAASQPNPFASTVPFPPFKESQNMQSLPLPLPTEFGGGGGHVALRLCQDGTQWSF